MSTLKKKDLKKICALIGTAAANLTGECVYKDGRSFSLESHYNTVGICMAFVELMIDYDGALIADATPTDIANDLVSSAVELTVKEAMEDTEDEPEDYECRIEERASDEDD